MSSDCGSDSNPEIWIQSLATMGDGVSSGGIAIILSLPRLVGIWYFQLSKFPRMGGEVSHMQVIGGKQWNQLFIGSFMDQGIIAEARHSEYLGYYWDYSNFIGILAVVVILIGLTRLKNYIKHPFIWAIFLACWFQVSITQDAHVADRLRAVIPLFKQITWYWRGYAIWLFAAAFLLAVGFYQLWHKAGNWGKIIASLLLLGICVEILLTHRMTIDSRSVLHGGAIWEQSAEPEVPLSKVFAPCYLGYIYGYGNETPVQLTADFKPGSILGESREHPGYFNMHDVRQLSCDEAKGGYYLNHQWPLLSLKDKDFYERFINYQQVVELPVFLQWLNRFSMAVWVLLFICTLFLIIPPKRPSRSV